jgi:hypothetical protein
MKRSGRAARCRRQKDGDADEESHEHHSVVEALDTQQADHGAGDHLSRAGLREQLAEDRPETDDHR